MKIISVIAATTVLMLPCSVASVAPVPVKQVVLSEVVLPAAARPTGFVVTRTIVPDRQRATPDRLQNSMPPHEQKTRNPRAGYERPKVYGKNLITISDVDVRVRSLARPPLDGEQTREQIAAERRAHGRAAKEKIETPRRTRKSFRSRAALIHFEGSTHWSLTTGLDKIDRFYRERFGLPLPISAMGQSHTHDRLGLDHSDAVDVAVRPDSVKGRSLMAFLRRAEIPFMAFRGRISRMSTGPHIHIGRPSPRLIEVKRRAAPGEDAAENG